MSYKIKGDLLEGDKVKFVKTPNHSGAFTPDSIVIHYTGGPTLESAIRTLTAPSAKASAHLVIGRDGTIVQLAPFNIITWHAGISSYAGRSGYNNYSIGIEIVNEGPLTQSGNIFRSWSGKQYAAEDAIELIHRNQTKPKFWHAYSPEQIEVVEDVCRLLMDTYSIKYILGHEEIAPQRKSDPGPAFPLDKIRNRLQNAARNDDEIEQDRKGRISVDKLNFRAEPSPKGAVISTLAKNKQVKILEEKEGWYKVAIEVEGWVFGKYVDLE